MHFPKGGLEPSNSGSSESSFTSFFQTIAIPFYDGPASIAHKSPIGAVNKSAPGAVLGRQALWCLGCTLGHDCDGNHAHDLTCHCPIFGPRQRSDGDGGLYDSRYRAHLDGLWTATDGSFERRRIKDASGVTRPECGALSDVRSVGALRSAATVADVVEIARDQRCAASTFSSGAPPIVRLAPGEATRSSTQFLNVVESRAGCKSQPRLPF